MGNAIEMQRKGRGQKWEGRLVATRGGVGIGFDLML